MTTGRRSLLTPELIKRAKKLLPDVVHLTTLADSLGIGLSTVYDWMNRGRKSEGKESYPESEKLFVEFSETIKKGLAEAKIKLVREIIRDASWQSKAWVLERRWPEEWGSQTREINELKKRIAKLEKEDGGIGGTGAEDGTN